MHFELKFSETKAFILSIEFTAITYFIFGLGLGICVLLLYSYFKNLKGGNV